MINKVQQYRERRKAVKVSVARTAREIALAKGVKGQACAPIAQDLIDRIEALLNGQELVVASYCAQMGVEPPKVHRDWTFRTFEAVASKSRGGEKGLKLRLAKVARMFSHSSTNDFKEYTRLAGGPVGGLAGLGLEQYLSTLLAHEAAHYIAAIAGEKVLRMGRDWIAFGKHQPCNANQDPLKGAHEACWQAVYFELRDAFGLNELTPWSKPSKFENKCLQCGSVFASLREAKTCSPRCRVAFNRASKG